MIEAGHGFGHDSLARDFLARGAVESGIVDLFGAPEEEPRLHVFRNTVVEWVVAWSIEDARQVMREYLHQQYPPRFDERGFDWSEACWSFKQEPDSKILKIRFDETTKRGKLRSRRMSCRRWAEQHGRGFLCSTEY